MVKFDDCLVIFLVFDNQDCLCFGQGCRGATV
jgi:hypothetical protein